MMIFDIETTGLEKESDRITCIGCYNERTNDVITFIDEDEKSIIEGFFNLLHESGALNTLYSFNGDFFDIPFLIHRALRTGAKGPEGFQFPKHKDLRKIYHGFFYNYENIKYKKGSLDFIGQEFLNMKPKSTDGEAVVKAFERGDIETVKEHCEYDVLMTYHLFKRLEEIGLV